MVNIEHANPFIGDPDRHEIWEMLMRRDFKAFVSVDWSLVDSDFHAEGFLGIDAGKLRDPDNWRLQFPEVEIYRREWLAQAAEFKQIELVGISTLDFLFQSAALSEIEIKDGLAVAHKKFSGSATTTSGATISLIWQSLYFLRQIDSRWKITGFVGYLPNPMT